MRVFTLALVALLASTTLNATIALADSGKGHNFGSAVCSQRVPCPDQGPADSNELTQIANSCITQNFGYTSKDDGFFDSFGLDSNNCLSTKSTAVIKGMGPALVPQCCVIKLQDSSCAIHCDLLSN